MRTNSGTPSTATSRKGLVLLHGLFRSPRSMARMAKRGEEEGYEVFNVGYPSRQECIEELTGIVRKQIERWQEIEGVTSLNFVTHSLGGIILRHLAPTIMKGQKGRAVMLGAPNQGSELADYLMDIHWFRWLNGPAGTQLGTQSKAISENLAVQVLDIGIIAGTRSSDPLGSALLPKPNDGRVTVERTRLEGMKDHLVLPVTHTFMMNDPTVIDATFRFLEQGKF